MVVLRSEDVLDIWERGLNRPPYARALLLLAAAQPDQRVESLAAWSLGRRDAALLSLHEQLFGEQVVAAARCPQCGERYELAFRTTDVRAGYAESELPPRRVVAADGMTYTLRLRPLSSEDLLAVAAAPDRYKLFQRLVLSAERQEETVHPSDLPAEVLADCEQALAEADPQADIQLALHCPDCGHAWDAPFDIVTYLWQEIDAWAGRRLREVHLLASAYGWSEAEILGLSPARRRYYLELVVG